MMADERRAARDIFTVSRLNREARIVLEQGLPMVWVEAEISNITRPSSGHWYFTLKDSGAQMRAAMFRQRNRLTRAQPIDGQQVLARGRVTLYEPRGDYQFVVEHMEDAGLGALQREFERIKAKLAAEGLFAPERKRKPPPHPRRIGVVTSASGAAIRDVLHVLARRFPSIPVMIYPSSVQGREAPGELIAALRLAGLRAECDVLILTRGGGSIEDLWAFNDEALARAIATSPIPIISGVGHEIDFTIADFAADVRAPTPSAAAEIAVPDGAQYCRALDASLQRLRQQIGRSIQQLTQKIAYLERRAQNASPMAKLRQQTQRIDELDTALQRSFRRAQAARVARVDALQSRMERASPARRVSERAARHRALAHRFCALMSARIARSKTQFALLERTLKVIGPDATLSRGYAIVRTEHGVIVRDPAGAPSGARIDVRVEKGHFKARVE